MRPAVSAIAPLLLSVLVATSPAAALAIDRAPSAAATTAAPGWSWPVEGERRVVRPFAAPPSPYAAGHRGVDLGASAPGAAVLAATGGVVHFAGVVVDRGVITIRSGVLLITVEPVDPAVATGDRVEAGDVIGALEAGHCGEPCVHVGVREGGEYVSPLHWLGGLRRAVLLPLG